MLTSVSSEWYIPAIGVSWCIPSDEEYYAQEHTVSWDANGMARSDDIACAWAGMGGGSWDTGDRLGLRLDTRLGVITTFMNGKRAGTICSNLNDCIHEDRRFQEDPSYPAQFRFYVDLWNRPYEPTSDDEEEAGHALEPEPGDIIRISWGEPTSVKAETSERRKEAFEKLMGGGRAYKRCTP